MLDCWLFLMCIDLKTLEPQAPPNLPQGGVVYPYGP